MSPIGLMTDTLLNMENVNDENQLDKKKSTSCEIIDWKTFPRSSKISNDDLVGLKTLQNP